MSTLLSALLRYLYSGLQNEHFEDPVKPSCSAIDDAEMPTLLTATDIECYIAPHSYGIDIAGVMGFSGCWTPYQAHLMWHLLNFKRKLRIPLPLQRVVRCQYPRDWCHREVTTIPDPGCERASRQLSHPLLLAVRMLHQ